MKKLISFLMILTLGAGIHLQASKPIPSYNAKVSGSETFVENHQSNGNSAPDWVGKREMVIVAQVSGPVGTPVNIWVYSLDLQDILGPYILYDRGSITVEIDDRNWGVLIQCEYNVTVSIWSGDGGGSTIGATENL
jgi:hypothetical protein